MNFQSEIFLHVAFDGQVLRTHISKSLDIVSVHSSIRERTLFHGTFLSLCNSQYAYINIITSSEVRLLEKKISLPTAAVVHHLLPDSLGATAFEL